MIDICKQRLCSFFNRELDMNLLFEYTKSLYRLLGISNKKIRKMRKEFFEKHDSIDFYNIPIFIISYNRFSYIQSITQQLEKLGYHNLKIIDNASTYPPLLEYYETTKYEVFRLDRNYGHKVFWENECFEEFRKDLYIVTDPDIMPIESCPNDFVKQFYLLLKKYPRIKKVGFSLKIDDIPKDAPMFEAVNQWEKAYNFFKIPWENAYSADIDTTFALYIPDSLDVSRHFITAIRTGVPIQARHLPWYKNEKDITDEDIYYSEHRNNGFWDAAIGGRTEEGPSDNKW